RCTLTTGAYQREERQAGGRTDRAGRHRRIADVATRSEKHREPTHSWYPLRETTHAPPFSRPEHLHRRLVVNRTLQLIRTTRAPRRVRLMVVPRRGCAPSDRAGRGD